MSRCCAEIDGAVQHGRRNTRFEQLRGLILHQRDQRAHHHRDAIHGRGRQLIAQRFSAAGGHDRRHIATLQDAANDGFLFRPELRITPVFLE